MHAEYAPVRTIVAASRLPNLRQGERFTNRVPTPTREPCLFGYGVGLWALSDAATDPGQKPHTGARPVAELPLTSESCARLLIVSLSDDLRIARPVKPTRISRRPVGPPRGSNLICELH
jgi:hypothetical protein